MHTTLNAAKVYIASRRISPVAETDEFGKFRVDGLCIMNEKIIVEAAGHRGIEVTPTEVNLTHWSFNATLEAYGKMINCLPLKNR